MADFEEALNSLLADPDAMGQIMALAGKLGLGDETASPDQGETPAPQEAPSAPEGLPPLFGPDQLGQMGKLLELVQASRQTDREADALIAALRPFLRADRQRKLDRAVQLAGLSRAARQAYRLWKEGELHL
ncbi:MAG: hypothetical protein MR419_07445 [Clostridiales bacterium]|nr:hypothetical protein [Clostridiales bacterium]MDY4171819.1 hypothetical protein [Evtepia sp.]